MIYRYELSEAHKKQYKFSHLICNGWLGIYADKSNKKWDESVQEYKKIHLTENELTDITNNSISCVEYV